MPRASPSLPEVRANSAQWVATCMPVVHIFSPLIDPARDAVAGRRHRAGLHVGGVRAVVGLGQAEGDAVFAGDRAFDHRLLVVAAVAVEHGDQRQIADDRMLVLQIVVQAEALGGEMLADHRHPEIGAVLAAIALRDREAQMPGGVGEVLRLAQQRFPFMPRQAAVVEIGARPFAAMVEEADVVVGLFERLDLARDEAVEFVEIGDEVGRQCKIQGSSPEVVFRCRGLIVAPIKVTSRIQVKQRECGLWRAGRLA